MRREAFLLLLVALSMLMLLVAEFAYAEPITVKWINQDPEITATQLMVCTDSGQCATASVSCGPGATCATAVNLPAGFHILKAVALGDPAGGWSAPSNEIDAIIWRLGFPPRADLNGDRGVTIADFSLFLQELGRSE